MRYVEGLRSRALADLLDERERAPRHYSRQRWAEFLRLQQHVAGLDEQLQRFGSAPPASTRNEARNDPRAKLLSERTATREELGRRRPRSRLSANAPLWSVRADGGADATPSGNGSRNRPAATRAGRRLDILESV